MAGKNQVLFFGKLSTALTKNFDLRGEIYYAQIDWGRLWSILKNKKSDKITVPSKFPAVRRDLAILVDKAVTWDQINTVLKETRIPILSSFDLFDVFEDSERLGKEKKSLAISLVFENTVQTMKDSDLEKAMTVIQGRLSEKVGAVLR